MIKNSKIYKYIVDSIIDFFDENPSKRTQKYYYSVENNNQILALENELQNNDNIDQICINHDRIKDLYKTYYNKKHKLIFALGIQGQISNDFLVTLRNIIGEGEYAGYSIIMIFKGELDSISRGTKSLESVQMPLNVDFVLSKIEKQLKKEHFKNNKDLKILNILISKSYNDFYDINKSIFDIEIFLDIITKKEIYDEDYKSFNLFPYNCPENISNKNIEKELNDNASKFEKIMQSHSIGNLGKIDSDYTGETKRQLKKENWEAVPYSKVKQSYDNAKIKSKIEYYPCGGDTLKALTEENETFLDIPESSTVAGKRKRNIIIFNKENAFSHTINLKFSKNIKKDCIEKGKELVQSSGKNLIVKINKCKSDCPDIIEYKHEEKKFIFKIIVIPVSILYFDNIEFTNLSINIKSNFKKHIRLEYITNQDCIRIGDTNKLEKNLDAISEGIIINKNNSYLINLEMDNIVNSALLKYEDNDFKFEINVVIEERDKKVAINPSDVIALKIQNEISFDKISTSVLRLGLTNYKLTNEALIEMIKVEEQLVNMKCLGLKSIEENIIDISDEIIVPDILKHAYIKLLQFFKGSSNIPLLMFWDDDALNVIKEYVDVFFKCINDVDNHQGEDEFLDLLKIGSYYKNGELYFTSLNIINLLYYSHLIKYYGGVKFPRRFNDLLNSSNQIPFIYNVKKDEINPILYIREENHKFYGWTVYKKNELNYSKESKYIRKIANEKITQYTKHFDYLFKSKLNPCIVINIVSVNDIDNFILGVMDFVKNQFKCGFIGCIPTIKINLKKVDENQKNIIDFINNTNDIDVISQITDFEFSVPDFDDKDIFIEMMKVIKVNYVDQIEVLPEEHLSFVELSEKPSDKSSDIFENKNSFFINGLVSSMGLTPVNQVTHYTIGMNKEKYNESDFLKSIEKLNGYSYKLKGKNMNKIQKEIVTSIVYPSTDNYSDLMQNSDWITIISPTMTPNYYVKNSINTIVLHYNDRYTNTSSYDAITISQNSQKYKNVLKNILLKKAVFKEEKTDVDEVINTFNAINGEWLLKMINSHETDMKEKLSLVTVTKVLLKAFDSDDMLWIPISMEEILRVSGALKISGNDGLFNVSALDLHGSRSDDLMLVGFIKKKEKINVSFVPVEVKVGKNKNNVIKKAIEQLENTSETLDDYIYNDNKVNKLQKDILTNFFIQIAINNYTKFVDFGVVKSTEMFDEVMNSIETDKYEVIKIPKFKDGMLFCLSSDIATTTQGEYDSIFKIEMSESIIEQFLNQNIDKIKLDFNYTIENLNLNQDENKQKFEETDLEVEVIENNRIVNQLQNEKVNNASYIQDENHKLKYTEQLARDNIEKMVDNVVNYETSSSGKILIGKTDKYHKDTFWEFKNKGLQNRHLLVTGSSGSGKTYAIQTLMYEALKNDIPIVVFDYTEGFRPGQLSPEFRESMGDKIVEHIVLKEKVGINPFARYEIDFGDGDKMLEETHLIANRITESFKNVYNLGDQQYSALFEAIKNGIDIYGDKFDFSMLNKELEESENKAALSVRSKILPLMSAKVFSSNKKLDWRDIHKDNKLHIIQMMKYSREIQTILTELILWDFWNYIKSNGTEDRPIVIVLDEAQNISHSEKSPSGYILTEGRKFGVSGWYATQFLKNSVNNDEIERLQQAAQKLFFRPTETGVSEVASYLSREKEGQQKWKIELPKLRKGECISVGSEEDMAQLMPYAPKVLKITSFQDRMK